MTGPIDRLRVAFRASAATAPVTWGQQRVLRLSQELQPGHAALNLAFSRPLRPGVTLPEIAAALSDLLAGCEALRTRFARGQGPTVQEVSATGTLWVEVRSLPAANPALAERVAQELAGTPFAEDREWPARIAVLDVGGQPRYLALAVSHAAADFEAATWLLWHLRDVLEDEFSVRYRNGCVAQPRDVAQWENSAEGRREADRAMRRLGRSLAAMPQSMLPRLPREPLDPRFRYVAMRSAAAAWCVAALGRRHGVGETAVLHAALSTVLSRVSGLVDVHWQLCVANRVDVRFAGVVGSLTQDVPTCTNLRDVDFAGLLGRSAGAVFEGVRNGRFPPDELDEIRASIERERGVALDLSFWLNSRITSTVGEVPAPSRNELRDRQAGSAIRDAGGDQYSTSTLFVFVDRHRAALVLRILVDTAYIVLDEARSWLRSTEAVLCEAALDTGLTPLELAEQAGIPPARYGPDWAYVQRSWVHLPTVAEAVRRRIPDGGARVAVRGSGDDVRLVVLVDDPAAIGLPWRPDLADIRQHKVSMLPSDCLVES